MNNFKTIFRSAKFNFTSIAILVMGCFILLPVPAWAEGTTYASDLLPPQIKIISPLNGSLVDTSTPKIVVSFSDMGSGLDVTTIHLILDRRDITTQSKIERLDITGQAINSPFTISYQPILQLTEGTHELYFSVRDNAGNLAELRWNFKVEPVGEEGIQVGGSNTLQFEQSPITMTTDILDLAIQGKLLETDVQFHFLGRATNYPGTSPNYSNDDYNFYLDKYSLGFFHQKAGLVLGCTTTSLESELLQIGLGLKGGAVNVKLDKTSGEYDLSLFSGQVDSTYALNMSVYNITGINGEWDSQSGLDLGGFYVRLDDDASGYDFTGIKGNTILGRTALFRFEAAHGISRADNTSGNGIVFHFEKPLSTSVLGLNYIMLQPDYPVPGSPLSQTLTQGGMQRVGIQSVTVIGNGHSINFDGSYFNDNLYKNVSNTNYRGNVNLGYNFNADTGFDFSAAYQGDFQYSKLFAPGHENQVNNSFLLEMKKDIKKSTLQSSLSFKEIKVPDPAQSLHQIQLFSGWIHHAGIYNITPSVQWFDETKFNGAYNNTLDTRLTWDMPLHPQLPRSKIALFLQKNDILNSSEEIHQIRAGLASTIYIMMPGNSTLSLTCNCSKWIEQDAVYTEGWDTTLSIALKAKF